MPHWMISHENRPGLPTVLPGVHVQPAPALGLINLAAAVRELGQKVTILDMVLALREKTLEMGRHLYDACAEWILRHDPDLVAFSAQCTTYPAIIQIAPKLRGGPRNVKIVLGGHNASFLDEATLQRYPFIDAVVRGAPRLWIPQEALSAAKVRKRLGRLEIAVRFPGPFL